MKDQKREKKEDIKMVKQDIDFKMKNAKDLGKEIGLYVKDMDKDELQSSYINKMCDQIGNLSIEGKSNCKCAGQIIVNPNSPNIAECFKAEELKKKRKSQ